MTGRPMTCERCGAAFGCGVDTGSCWCAELPPLAERPEDFEDCLCPTCLTQLAAPPSAPVAAE